MMQPVLPIQFSDRATLEILDIYRNKIPDMTMGLRVGVQASGCSGTSYVLGFDHAGEADQCFEWNGMRVIIAKKHYMYLVGITIDFVDDAQHRGFVFNFEQK